MPGKAVVGAAVVAAGAYAALWVGVGAQWAWLESADTYLLRRFHDIGVNNHAWIDFWRWISDLFSPTALRVTAFIGIVVALVRRRSRVAGFLAVTVMPSGLVTAAAKALSDRPRPASALTHAGSSSFPSGHALGITVAVLALVTLLWPRLAPSRRLPVIAAGAGLVLLVGLSRVVLNVHHPSDVLAGWALGCLYFLLCLVLVPPGIRGVSAL